MPEFACLKNVTRADLVRICDQATAFFLELGWLEPGEYFAPETAVDFEDQGPLDACFHVVGGRYGTGDNEDGYLYKSMKLDFLGSKAGKWPAINASVMDEWRDDHTVQFLKGSVFDAEFFGGWSVEQLQAMTCALGSGLIYIHSLTPLPMGWGWALSLASE